MPEWGATYVEQKKEYNWLVVYLPTPLKNDGVRQLGLYGISIPNIWKHKTCSKPPTRQYRVWKLNSPTLIDFATRLEDPKAELGLQRCASHGQQRLVTKMCRTHFLFHQKLPVRGLAKAYVGRTPKFLWAKSHANHNIHLSALSSQFESFQWSFLQGGPLVISWFPKSINYSYN